MAQRSLGGEGSRRDSRRPTLNRGALTSLGGGGKRKEAGKDGCDPRSTTFSRRNRRGLREATSGGKKKSLREEKNHERTILHGGGGEALSNATARGGEKSQKDREKIQKEGEGDLRRRRDDRPTR